MLRYLTQAATRNAPAASFKGAVIGVEVFGLAADHDPRIDPIVRVSVREMRRTLSRYYETEGRHQPLRIKLPIGSYVPSVSYESTIAALILDDASAMHVANAAAAMAKRTLPAYEAALLYLDLALRNHPDHPRLLSLQAMAHASRAQYGEHPRTELAVAESLIDRAKRGGYEPWERLLVEAWIRMHLYFDWAGAERLFDRALQLNRIEAQFNSWYGGFLASQLRWREFLGLEEGAVVHSAHDSAFSRGRLAWAQIIVGKFDEAEKTLRLTFDLFPNGHYVPYVHWALLHEARGDFAGAIEALKRVSISARETMITIGLRPLLIGLAGDRRKARKLYHQLCKLKRSGQAFVPSLQLATACLGTGDLDAATEHCIEAVKIERDTNSSWLAIHTHLRHIHDHPGFRALITDTLKLKFPDARVPVATDALQ